MEISERTIADPDMDDDIRVLHSLGYAQELARRLSRFSNFAISFSIICILAGGVTSLAQATSGVGGAAIGLGWPLGVLLSGCFGLAMAQIASALERLLRDPGARDRMAGAGRELVDGDGAKRVARAMAEILR